MDAVTMADITPAKGVATVESSKISSPSKAGCVQTLAGIVSTDDNVTEDQPRSPMLGDGEAPLEIQVISKWISFGTRNKYNALVFEETSFWVLLFMIIFCGSTTLHRELGGRDEYSLVEALIRKTNKS
nr:hypothetical protein [Tanacetum cinerariifolium]